MDHIKVRLRLSNSRSYAVKNRSSVGGLNRDTSGGLNRDTIGGSEPKLCSYFQTGNSPKIGRRYTWKDRTERERNDVYRLRTSRYKYTI